MSGLQYHKNVQRADSFFQYAMKTFILLTITFVVKAAIRCIVRMCTGCWKLGLLHALMLN